MTRKQLTLEIQKLLDSTPDPVLSEILSYLKTTSGKSDKEINLSQNFRTILEEDKELLSRLAKWFFFNIEYNPEALEGWHYKLQFKSDALNANASP